MKNQKGFSLIELLVVVIIIGIIAAIAIPSLLSSRRAANEASAISNLRTVHTANATYAATTNQSGYFADSLAVLAGAPNLLDASWGAAAVKKNTFDYTYTVNASGSAVRYCLTAISTDAQAKSFAISTDGTLWQANGGTVTCTTASPQVIGGTGAKVVGS